MTVKEAEIKTGPLGASSAAAHISSGQVDPTLDQTRPDIETPVVRVIVPGLRHFYSRFAPGRLYDVPVKLGYLDQPLSENELTPFLPHT